MAQALVVLAMIVGVVFAHGGACAALVLSEAAAHDVHGHSHASAPTATAISQVTACAHDELPARHHHGMEQDLSVPAAPLTSFCPAGAPPSPTQAARVLHAPNSGTTQFSRTALADLCVMRA